MHHVPESKLPLVTRTLASVMRILSLWSWICPKGQPRCHAECFCRDTYQLEYLPATFSGFSHVPFAKDYNELQFGQQAADDIYNDQGMGTIVFSRQLSLNRLCFIETITFVAAFATAPIANSYYCRCSCRSRYFWLWSIFKQQL